MKIIAKNKIANFNYEIFDKYEAGIVLQGWEVKSIRAGKINLKGAFASFKKQELFLSNMHVSLYMAVKGDELQSRKLLLHKNQLLRIKQKQEQNKLTIIPLKIYFNSQSKIKIEIALAKGKNKADKRQSLKEQEAKREMKQILGM